MICHTVYHFAAERAILPAGAVAARRHGAHEREDDVLPSMHKQWGVSLMIHSFSEKWKFWTQ